MNAKKSPFVIPIEHLKEYLAQQEQTPEFEAWVEDQKKREARCMEKAFTYFFLCRYRM